MTLTLPLASPLALPPWLSRLTELRVDVHHGPKRLDGELASIYDRLRDPADRLHGIPRIPLDDPELVIRYREADGEFYVYVEDIRRRQLAGYTVFNRLVEVHRRADRYLRAPHSKYDPQYQRRGLATAVYRWGLDAGLCLLTGARQSPAAHALWHKLAADYPLGCVDLRDKTLTWLGHEVSPQVLGELHTRMLLLGRGWTLAKFTAATGMLKSSRAGDPPAQASWRIKCVPHPEFFRLKLTGIRMNARRPVAGPLHRPGFKALVLQGGGALGAYQAGVYEALADQHAAPQWIAGVSIGAINSALIAGNAPERRVERLREFWQLVSSGPPQRLPTWLADRPTLNQWSAGLATVFGIPGFFKPRLSPTLMMGGQAPMLSYYDTTPLKQTLERLVDFDRINAREVRLSVGAVNVRTGNAVYFDNAVQKIGPEHIMASGALPPGFAPVEVDGELYWDGGLVSNTPLQYLLDNQPGSEPLVVMQVDLFNARGAVPRTMSDVLTRQKDITYSSRTRMNTDALAANVNLQQAIADLIGKLPPALRKDPSVQAVQAQLTHQPIDIFHLIYRDKPYERDSKDYEFSRTTVEDHWEIGLRDMQRVLSHPDALESRAQTNGVTTFDLGEPGAVRIKRPMATPATTPESP